MDTFVPITVAETKKFMTQVGELLTDEDRVMLIDFLAKNPEAGDLIQGTGGIRKLRWGGSGRGKRGGARVVYYFHNATMPIFALSIYAKNVKIDLSSDEKTMLRSLAATLVKTYTQKRKGPI